MYQIFKAGGKREPHYALATCVFNVGDTADDLFKKLIARALIDVELKAAITRYMPLARKLKDTTVLMVFKQIKTGSTAHIPTVFCLTKAQRNYVSRNGGDTFIRSLLAAAMSNAE